MKIKLLTIVCFCFVNIVLGQKENYVWYFGNHAGVDFNSGSPVALTNGMLSTSEGCSSISDANGNLLFYTDGITVYDRNHNQMPNGDSLKGGHSSTQSALIVPFPGNNLMYYIFTMEQVNFPTHNFFYSTIDMSLNVGNGDVLIKNYFLNSSFSEKLTAVRHSNNNDVWVIAHSDSLNTFYSYLVTSAGISSPLLSNVGTFNNDQDGVGQMKFSSDGTKIAYASWGTNYVDLFDFNTTTGLITNEKFIYVPPGVTWGAYGLEFSQSGNYLYCCGAQTKILYQWDISSNSAPIINLTRQLIDSTTNPSYGQLQLGPDGKIYLAKGGSGFLSRINNPELPGSLCNYVSNAVSLAGNNCELGLPNFITSYFLTAGISTNNAQQNQLSIYPNPADEEFTVSGLRFTVGDEIRITDALGKILYRKIFSSPTVNCKLQTANFSNGIYFLNVQTEREVVAGKIVINH